MQTPNMQFSNVTVTDTLTAGTVVVTGDIQVAGNLSVNNITTNNITINGHIVTAGNTPTVTVGTAAGSEDTLNNIPAPQVSIEGNDTSGTITIVAGANTTAGELATIMFSTPFQNKPRVVVTPANRDSVSINAYYEVVNTEQFKIISGEPAGNNMQYQFTYFVVE
jgi:hypothetical protein